MRLNHILNLGYPKCGTSWCWHVLKQQAWFSAPQEKENLELIKGVGVHTYFESYKDYDITANFTPNNFALDRFIVKQLSEHGTVTASIILRDPFEIYWSLYNFLPQQFKSYNEYVDNLLAQGWFNQTSLLIERWQQYFGARFQIFFYEDIKQDPSKFLVNYCHKMNLPKPIIIDTSFINVTRYGNRPPEVLNAKLVGIINRDIENLQMIVDQNITRWKNVS